MLKFFIVYFLIICTLFANDFSNSLYDLISEDDSIWSVDDNVKQNHLKLESSLNNTLKQKNVYSYEDLLDNIKTFAPKILLQKLETASSAAELRSVRSELYPTFNLSLNEEYSKRYDDFPLRNTSVGNDSIIQSTGYQAYASIGLNYNIFNFGSTLDKIDAYKAKIKSSKQKECMVYKDVALYLLDEYYKAMILKERLKYTNDLLSNLTQIYENKKRLNEVGELPKSSIFEGALKIADESSNLSYIQKDITQTLSNINYITGANISDINVLVYFRNVLNNTKFINFYETPKAKQLFYQIEEKRNLLNSEFKNYFPSLSLYARYNFYGYDRNDIIESIDKAEKNGYKFGLVISYTLFDGFRRESRIENAKIEYLKSNLELVDAKREYEQNIKSLQENINQEQNKISNLANSKDYSKNILNIANRLNKSGEENLNNVIESINLDMRKNIELIQSKIKLDMLKVKKDIISSDKLCDGI
ncbi:TolC-like outer membrane efflux protein [Campylobacter sputorum aubsp. sputorum RM3237]|uniref:Outer membrane efflux protein n=1 Tax=Campylobacter sputorum subsp. sputorum TaxID=32024 RepID=A0A381DKR7_9BACT|nr:TolC family protein [Campylobacter sputorum]ASM34627.1 TolC-like outer membrane efflux protein [Campylobacter sputorum aubsp. sputorum RM3237]KAB0581158.1 TolC family protein [Campylobacter sputorum subsp. sputorum]QEL04818.1 outer membrane efflux protein, TolC family [Campylobacter sputorum subsp. sputorum]SUX11304.1 outer membrane efflux protein [Campylobacter sputorum subsp. sputorum]